MFSSKQSVRRVFCSRGTGKQGMANFDFNQSNIPDVGQLYRPIMFIYLLFAQLKH